MSDDLTPTSGAATERKARRYLSEHSGVVVRAGVFVVIALAAFGVLWNKADTLADQMRAQAGDVLRLQIETSRDRDMLLEIRADIKDLKAFLQHRAMP